MKNKGILIVVSGYSGSGKGTIMKSLLEQYKDRYALSISATTRSPRPGETDGIEYFFKTKEEFESMIEHHQLIEHANYVGNYYGTPKEYVEKMLDNGKDVILEIEIQGAMKIKEQYPDAVLLFVAPPTAKELKDRLVGRNTESLQVIEARLKRASAESEGVEAYDYYVINDQIEECVKTVHTIISCEHLKVARNSDTIKIMREELKGFSKGE